jgi:hypothetical protein
MANETNKLAFALQVPIDTAFRTDAAAEVEAPGAGSD